MNSHLATLKKELQSLKLSAEFWDVRIEDSFKTQIDSLEGDISSATCSPSLGAFVRLRKNSFWMFESTTDLTKIKNVLQKLDETKTPIKEATPYPSQKAAPFLKLSAKDKKISAIPMKDKISLVAHYTEILKNYPKIVSSKVRYRDEYKVKSYLNSLGTEFEFDFNQGGLTLIYTLKDGSEKFEDFYRIYGSDFSQLKVSDELIYDFIKESEAFIHAPSITPGKYRVLLDPEVAGIFTHESFGHKSEADFMLGNTTALEEWKIGKKIAADCLSIVDDGTFERTSGYCPIDDEGIPAQKNYLIKDGVLMGRLHSIETAQALNEKPTGNARAMTFEWEPIVRMTSTFIEPGTESINSILARCEGALLVKGAKHGSGLSTFTIAPNRGYLIGPKQSKTPVKLAVISGSVFETLGNIEAVSSEFELHSSAIGGCGKMDQSPLPVSDGGPYVLVKEMQVS